MPNLYSRRATGPASPQPGQNLRHSGDPQHPLPQVHRTDSLSRSTTTSTTNGLSGSWRVFTWYIRGTCPRSLGEVINGMVKAPYPSLELNTHQGAFTLSPTASLSGADLAATSSAYRPYTRRRTAPSVLGKGRPMANFRAGQHGVRRPKLVAMNLAATGEDWSQPDQHPSTLRVFKAVPSYQDLPFYSGRRDYPLWFKQEDFYGVKFDQYGGVRAPLNEGFVLVT
ncbi:hypothetical protein DL765_005973 [Monosporascus sp. GIB2]|nr:hypothetical protein DL765_005973 [Monosporascus sp. GIB2]